MRWCNILLLLITLSACTSGTESEIVLRQMSQLASSADSDDLSARAVSLLNSGQLQPSDIRLAICDSETTVSGRLVLLKTLGDRGTDDDILEIYRAMMNCSDDVAKGIIRFGGAFIYEAGKSSLLNDYILDSLVDKKRVINESRIPRILDILSHAGELDIFVPVFVEIATHIDLWPQYLGNLNLAGVQLSDENSITLYKALENSNAKDIREFGKERVLENEKRLKSKVNNPN